MTSRSAPARRVGHGRGEPAVRERAVGLPRAPFNPTFACGREAAASSMPRRAFATIRCRDGKESKGR